jgi:hypothetical protein
MESETMTYDEARTAIAAGDELTDEVKAALAAYDPQAEIASAVKAQADTIAAAARKDEHAKLVAEQERATALQAQLDAAEANTGTEAEQQQKRYDALTQTIEKLTGDLTAEKESRAAAERTGTLQRLGSTLKFNAETVTGDYSSWLVQQALADVQTADLGNEAVVGPILATLKTSNPQLFAADVPSGTGGNGGSGAGGGGSQRVSEAAVLDAALNGDMAKADAMIKSVSTGVRDGSVVLES